MPLTKASFPVMAAIGNSGLGDKTHPARDTLFFKIQGDAKTVKNAADVVKSITKKHGSSGFDFAATDEEADDMWQQRKYALMSTMAIDPTTRCWTTDVWCVASLTSLIEKVVFLMSCAVVCRCRSFLSS